jgi:hypothetical protein
MTQHFAVGDRVIVSDAQMARMPHGTVGTIVRVFVHSREICDVQFDTYAMPMVVLCDALAPAPASDAPTPTHA